MSSENRSVLRSLGAALMNATLLLAALVLALAVTLVWQVRGLAQDLRGSVAFVQPQIDAARTQAQVALETLERSPEGAGTQAAQDNLRAALERLAQIDTQSDPDVVDGIMRQVALAVFSTVAQRILDSE